MNIRRIKTGVLAAVLCLSLSSCGKKVDDTDPDAVYKPQSSSAAKSSSSSGKTDASANDNKAPDESQEEEKKKIGRASCRERVSSPV